MALESAVPISIHLETRIQRKDEEEHHVYDEEGTIAQVGDNLYIRYEETNPENDDNQPVTVKIVPNGDVQVTRGRSAGNTFSRLFFSNGKRVIASYRTPYGMLSIETVTQALQVRIRQAPLAGRINIAYQLMAAGEYLGDYQLQLLFGA
ncbi:DUF1934 domain-containing protein [Schleiferilactobacillus perolens]|uniref:DUF1934 domain-containing protein n=1 Tax=Schleiferilactobacillus perolens DSM 12744 TaxID=1423792 RepID=A0A0R1MT68_9LACO|nr:DUF1934 domain-containing protein [Schleiferilactobacillus perolens]KRL08788.1 hypothetical protein FD09_GL001161 [Schleiferilactobacillus perolens DSM 12744]MCI1891943.1 DUF1934 domain-containing protein [Schleiferilactobacillus harbinensis]MCI1912789.1 DUF1934 domain-containing protein [Schleiferilactobacillus harbinensis]MCI2172417.1 DUF1934 domain-containing protein [Schleiferilactobacillus perolens]